MRTRKEVIEDLSKAIARRKEIDQEIDTLDAELKLLDEIPALPTQQNGSLCYHLSETFNVSGDSIVSSDQVHWNMFHTQEYAKVLANWVILLSKLLHCKWYLDRDFRPNWRAKELKYSIVYLEGVGKFGVNTRIHSDPCTVCFSTLEKAERAADWMNEHALDNVTDAVEVEEI